MKKILKYNCAEDLKDVSFLIILVNITTKIILASHRLMGSKMAEWRGPVDSLTGEFPTAKQLLISVNLFNCSA